MWEARRSSREKEVCRLCLSSISSFRRPPDLQHSCEAIREIFKININTDDDRLLPLKFCPTCVEGLSQFYKFFQKIKKGLSELEHRIKFDELEIKLENDSFIPFPFEVKREFCEDDSNLKPREIVTADLLKPIVEVEYGETKPTAPFVDSLEVAEEKVSAEDEGAAEAADDDFEINIPNPITDLEVRIARLQANPRLNLYEKRRIFYEFMCCKCYTKFNEEAELEAHLKERHNVHRLIYSCCSKIQGYWVADNHIRFHIDSNAFQCRGCNERFATKGKYRYHAANCKVQVECPVCGKPCYPLQLRQHIHSHNPVKTKAERKKDRRQREKGCQSLRLICHFCGQTYKRRNSMLNHLQEMHFGKPVEMYVCEHCGFRTRNKKHIQSHVEAMHTEMKKECCPICNKLVRQLGQHMKLNHDKSTPSICNDCGKSYINRRLLVKHWRDKHDKRKPFVCATCGKAYKHKWELKEHSYTHLGTYKYSCEYCSFQVNYGRNLRMHTKAFHPEVYKQRMAKRLKETYGASMAPTSLEGNKELLPALKMAGVLGNFEAEQDLM